MKIENPKILIVEDDHAIRDVLLYCLSRSKYEILVAANGRDGLELVDQADLILLNLILPEMSGEEFLRIVRDSGNYTPVIVISAAMSREEGLVKLARYHIVDYIEKPFRTLDVVNSVQRMMLKAFEVRTVEAAPDLLDTFIRRQIGAPQKEAC